MDDNTPGQVLFHGAAANTHCAAAYTKDTAVYMVRVRIKLSQLPTKLKLKLKLSLAIKGEGQRLGILVFGQLNDYTVFF